MISSGAEVCVNLRGVPLHVLCWSGNNTRELCCILWSCCLYSTAKLQPVLYINCLVYYCYLLRFPSSPTHSLSTRKHSHLRHTHLTHRPFPERGYAILTTDMASLSCFRSNITGTYGGAMIHQSNQSINQSISIKPQYGQCG